jgi:hypothetical protein
VGSGRDCIWQESGFNNSEDVFRYNLMIRECYKCCTINKICKDNAVVTCVIVPTGKKLIPINFVEMHYNSTIYENC